MIIFLTRNFTTAILTSKFFPHIHIDFVPFATDQKRGLSTRVSLSKALEQQGFTSEGKFNTCSKLWIDNEKQVIADIMKEIGIEWEHKENKGEHLSVKEYKLKKRQEEIEKAETKLTEVKEQLSSAEEDLEKKQKKVHDIINFLPDIDREDKLEKNYFDISTKKKEKV